MPQLVVEIGANLTGSFTSRLKAADQAVATLRKSTAALDKAMKATLASSGKLAASMAKIAKAAKGVGTAFTGSASAAGTYRQSLAGVVASQNATVTSANAAAAAQRRLQAVMRRSAAMQAAQNRASNRASPAPGGGGGGGTPSPASGASGGMLAGFKRVGGFLSGVGITAAGVHATKEAGSADAAIRRIINTAELPKEAYEGIYKQLNDLSSRSETNLAPTDLASALDTFVSANIPIKEARNMLATTGKVAYAYNIAAEDAANLGVGMMNQFKISSAQFSKATDMAAIAGKEGAFELDDMARNFPVVASTAAQLGLKGLEGIASLTAFLQAVNKDSKDPSAAATYASDFFTKLFSQETNQNVAKYIGAPKGSMPLVDEQQKLIRQGKDPLIGIIEYVSRLTKGGTDQKAMSNMFSDQQVQRAVLAGVKYLAGTKEIKARQFGSDTDGTVNRDFKYQAAGTQGAIDASNNSLKRIWVAVGKILDKAGIVQMFEDLANWISKVTVESPNLAKGLIGIAGALAAIGLTAGPISVLLKAGSNIAAMASTTAGLSAALSTGSMAITGLTASAVASTAAIGALGIAVGWALGTVIGNIIGDLYNDSEKLRKSREMLADPVMPGTTNPGLLAVRGNTPADQAARLKAIQSWKDKAARRQAALSEDEKSGFDWLGGMSTEDRELARKDIEFANKQVEQLRKQIDTSAAGKPTLELSGNKNAMGVTLRRAGMFKGIADGTIQSEDWDKESAGRMYEGYKTQLGPKFKDAGAFDAAVKEAMSKSPQSVTNEITVNVTAAPGQSGKDLGLDIGNAIVPQITKNARASFATPAR